MKSTRTLGIATTLMLAALWFVLLRPGFLGGSASYVLVSGVSMQPGLATGDLAIMRKQARYSKGDVIAFQVEGGVVIHRIVGGNARKGYVTQGDNREEPDMWRPKPSNVGGALWFNIPKIGLAIAMLRQPLILAVFAGILGALTAFRRGSPATR